ncbi:MAG: multicopper oxidase domain-containing protein [Gammaproteobacteria bacterium]|nr:multicopper oxidase domain-containing protein [Gammaproteobacteria bacterium]
MVLAVSMGCAFGACIQTASAETVKVKMHAKEVMVEIDNKGTKFPAWTFDGRIPGPVVRVKEGDTVEFELVNENTNKNSHSMDFHAAQVDVLNEFAPIKPGETKKFTFDAKYPGVWMYHCGADPMHQHIARGMYGIIIVDPKEGYSDKFPKPDREYVLVQGQYYSDPEDHHAIMEDRGYAGSLINGKMFHYDPVHDQNASQVLEAKPGERVRIFYVNANVNRPAAIHPIAGIWDRVYLNGNPKNTIYGMATLQLGVSEAATLDIVSPKDRPTNQAIVDHTMGAAMRGAITVLMNKPDADPAAGKGDNILIR